MAQRTPGTPRYRDCPANRVCSAQGQTLSSGAPADSDDSDGPGGFCRGLGYIVLVLSNGYFLGLGRAVGKCCRRAPRATAARKHPRPPRATTGLGPFCHHRPGRGGGGTGWTEHLQNVKRTAWGPQHAQVGGTAERWPRGGGPPPPGPTVFNATSGAATGARLCAHPG